MSYHFAATLINFKIREGPSLQKGSEPPGTERLGEGKLRPNQPLRPETLILQVAMLAPAEMTISSCAHLFGRGLSDFSGSYTPRGFSGQRGASTY
jgi:hypothetical protein